MNTQVVVLNAIPPAQNSQPSYRLNFLSFQNDLKTLTYDLCDIALLSTIANAGLIKVIQVSLILKSQLTFSKFRFISNVLTSQFLIHHLKHMIYNLQYLTSHSSRSTV